MKKSALVIVVAMLLTVNLTTQDSTLKGKNYFLLGIGFNFSEYSDDTDKTII